LVEQYDLLFLQETKLDNLDDKYVQDTLQGWNYDVYFCNRFKVSNHKSGGIAVAVNKKYSKYVRFLETNSKYVLWLSMEKNVLQIDKDILFGCIYIPPEGSPYSDESCYDTIESELVNLNTDNTHGYYAYLIGDFNSRTGKLSEFVSVDERLAGLVGLEGDVVEALHSEYTLETLGIQSMRVTHDDKTNNFGNKLLEFCKSNELYICNGRVGIDAYQGRLTSKNSSIVDYFIGSARLLPLVHEFEVLMFDHLYSDIHSPVHCVLKSCVPVGTHCTEHVLAGEHSCNISRKVNWDDSKRDDFVHAIEQDMVQLLIDNMHDKDVNSTCEDIAAILEGAGKKVFKSTCTICGKNRKGKKKFKKQWFNADCLHSRRLYHRAKLKLRNDTSNLELQAEFKNVNKGHKRTMQKARTLYYREQAKRIRGLKSSNPNMYWKYLNSHSGKRNNTCQVKLDQLHDHFKLLNKDSSLNDQANGNNSEFEEVLNAHDGNPLNDPITEEEVNKAIKQLHMQKAIGIDKISNEYLKHGARIMLPVYVQLFNKVLDNGETPESWGIGRIIPIYKNKGSIHDPNNYRGITILSCLGKLFTGVLNNRLSTTVAILENQAGFRKGYATTDHIFVLRSLVDVYMHSKMKLYCAFVDFQKAFDTVWHVGLWRKLIKHDVKGKVLKCIFNMYQKIKSCVVSGGENTDFFTVSTGVRQGENLSPLLFAIYVNDLESYLMNQDCQYIPIGKYPHLNVMLKVLILLYADDTAVLSDTAQGLQKSLDGLAKYCADWKLKVNVEKTKVVIFSRRKVDAQFRYMGQVLETVQQFKYLGVIISSNGKYTECKKHLYNQGLKAMYAIISKGRLLQLPVDVMLHLFESMIVPILLYSCEVWGNEKSDILERLHLKLCKHILYLKQSTPNCMVYGETGRFPLLLTIKQRMVKYWGKIITKTNNDAFVCRMYNVLFRLYNEGSFASPWLEYIRTILFENGMGHIWISQSIPNVEWLNEAIKLRLQDQYKQEWHRTVETMPKCVTYRLFKQEWGQEKYLLELPKNTRIPMCKFRTCNHKLAVEKGRYRNIPRHERTCNMCNSNAMGDEFHFLLECRALHRIRMKYIPRSLHLPSNTMTFKSIMNDGHHGSLVKLSQFIKHGLQTIH
jgi:hypothetical protein